MIKWDGQYKPKIVEGPYRKRLDLSRKSFRIFLATLLLVLVCSMIFILCIRHAVSQQDPDVYVVQKGDTLWDISNNTH